MKSGGQFRETGGVSLGEILRSVSNPAKALEKLEGNTTQLPRPDSLVEENSALLFFEASKISMPTM